MKYVATVTTVGRLGALVVGGMLTVLGTSGCDGDDGDGTGVGAHQAFLSTCDEDDDCDGLSCECGVCTSSCSRDNDCATLDEGAVCVATAGISQCASSAAEVCFAGCGQDDDCNSGFTCEDDACVPEEETNEPPGVDCADYDKCDVDTSCDSGNCIAFSECSSAICIDGEEACELSCPDPSECVLAESYPEQLFCPDQVPAIADELPPPGVYCPDYDVCEDAPCETGSCMALDGCGKAICIETQEACELTCPDPDECELLESYPMQLACDGAVAADPGSTGRCSVLPEDQCADAQDCAPVLDLDGVYRGCDFLDMSCDDVLTCAENDDGELTVFADSCLPSGWTEVPYEECESSADCAGLDEETCADTDGCGALQDISGTFFECVDGEQACGEAETCAAGPGGAVQFPTTCLPEGYDELNDYTECEDQIECGFHRSEEDCAAAEGCFPVSARDAGFVGCLPEQGCGDAITCGISPSGIEDEFLDTCLPPGWTQCEPEPSTDLQWYSTCGDPVCGPDEGDLGLDACADGIEEGDPCEEQDSQCDAMLGCGASLICAESDPKLAPGGCPISRAKYKTDIAYVTDTDRQRLAQELLSVPLATYEYEDANSCSQQLGFIIEDVEPSPSVYSDLDRVNLYGYTSMVVATVQQQQTEIERLRTELNALRSEFAKLRGTGAGW